MKTCSVKLLSRRVLGAALSLVVCVLAATPAFAQLSGKGGPTLLVRRDVVAAPAIKGTDSGYDPANQAYLVVGSCYGGGCPSAFGAVYGIFVNREGQAISPLISINPGGSEGHFPRVRYAPQISGGGGFLVTWLEEGASGLNSVRARIIRSNGTLGTISTLNDGASYAWIESAAAVGYSPVSQRFLVAWRTYPHVFSAPHVASRLVDINGSPVESVVKLSAGFGRDPGVAWNSATNTFGVSFGAENSAGSAGFSSFAVVPPVNAASFVRNSFNTIPGFTYISDVDYNPDTGRYVMIWHQNMSGVPYEVRMAEIDANAQVVTTGLVSRDLPGYDAHSIGFNPVSRTFAMSSINGDDDVVAAELNSRGVRTSAITLLGPGVTGRYPRISANWNYAEWNVAFSNGFQSVVDLTFSTSSRNGGPSGTNPPPDGGGGTTPPSGGCTTVKPVWNWICVNGGWVPPPDGGGTGCSTPLPGVGWTCVNGNWLPPSGGGTGCTTVQPGPGWVCVNGGWVPGGGGGTSTCPTQQPGPDWICVNGGWIPPSNTGSCTTVKPGADWVCVNGNWVPGGGGGGGGGCTTPQPGPSWSCVNGGWIPPSNTGSCTTVKPGPDWVCVNGGWVPGSGGGGCTTAQPGPDWTCVNGNWLPPGTAGGCTTPQPGAGWGCVNGNWLPPTTSSSCPTVQPGPGWYCVNGDWRPPSAP